MLADLSRLRESESFLSGRVDELELEASNLKADLCITDKKIWDRERKWVEKVEILQDQLSIKSEDILTHHSLKIEVEGLKNEKSNLIKNLEEKCEDLDKAENAFRSEVNEADPNDQKADPNADQSLRSEITCSTQNSSRSSRKGSSLVRYRSLRDHNGRYYLVVKIH